MTVRNPKPDELDRPSAPPTSPHGPSRHVLVFTLHERATSRAPEVLVLDDVAPTPERLVEAFALRSAGRVHVPATPGRLAIALQAAGWSAANLARIHAALQDWPIEGRHEGLIFALQRAEVLR